MEQSDAEIKTAIARVVELNPNFNLGF